MGAAVRIWPGRTRESDRPDGFGALALGLVALAPLVWIPGGFSRFVLAKLLVTALAALAAALARPVGALPRPVLVVGLVWAGCFALAAVAGDTPLASLLGRWPRYEGLPTLGLYAAACWTGARVVGRGEAASRGLITTVGAMALVLGAFSVLDVLGISPLGPSAEARSGSVLGNATDQGSVAMMAALLLAAPVLRTARDGRRSSYWCLVAALVAAVATVAISGSRAALTLTLVGLLVTGLTGPLGIRATRGAALRATGVVVLLGAVALLVPSTRDRLLGLGTAEGRLHQWRLTLDLVLDHPVLGIGGSRYVDAFLAYEDAAFVDFTGAQRLADSPHSILLQVLVAGGLLLLVVTALGAYVVARRARAALVEHPEARPAALAVAAYLILACVNFTTAGPTCLAAFLLGVVIAVPPRAPGPTERPRPQRLQAAAAVASAAMALVLAGAVLGDVAQQQGANEADLHDVVRADDRLSQAGRWRGWDVDAPVIAARILAAEAAIGEAEAAVRGEGYARSALTRLPESYEALVALGVTLSAQGRVGEAAEVLDRAVSLAPQRPDGYVQRAIARAGLGLVDEALVDLRRAREIVPRSAVVRRLIRQVERS